MSSTKLCLNVSAWPQKCCAEQARLESVEARAMASVGRDALVYCRGAMRGGSRGARLSMGLPRQIFKMHSLMAPRDISPQTLDIRSLHIP